MARPVGFEGEYSKYLGITTKHLRRLGGFERLETLTPEARALLLKPNIYGGSRGLRSGGLKKRGMARARDIRSIKQLEKCPHYKLEVHDYRPEISSIGVRCSFCYAVMITNSRGLEWHKAHLFQSIPIERKYFKEFRMPATPDRMEGYKNHSMVRL
jgi:hypothetical protein